VATVSSAMDHVEAQVQQYQVLQPFLPRAGSLDLREPAQSAAFGIFHISAALALVMFVGVYVSIAPSTYLNSFLNLFGSVRRVEVSRLLEEIGVALKWWLLGQLIAMGVVGIITAIGLLALGLPMALPLAVLSTLLTFVPFIGAIVSAIPAALIGLTMGDGVAIYVLLVYLFAHLAEGWIVVPLIQHRFVHVPPALILAVQFLMERFVGIIGVALATPLLVVAMVLIQRLYYDQNWQTEKAA